MPTTEAAAGVAAFAMGIGGKRRARHAARLIVRLALAASVALAAVTTACDKPEAGTDDTEIAISQLPTASAPEAMITSQARASPAWFSNLVLLDPGTDTDPWAILAPTSGEDAPVLVDRTGAALDTVGAVYRLAAQPVVVGTRDGPSQFLQPLAPVEQQVAGSSGSDTSAARRTQIVSQWGQDERFLAPTRAIAGRPSVLDAAYNADAAVEAGGTHTYTNGVVLRVEPDQPVLQVIDRDLLQSGRPTRAEDVVAVAIRANERPLYEAGSIVNLRDVVMERRQTTVDGQATTIHVVNAALEGARVEPIGQVDLASLLQPRLQRVDQTLASEVQQLGPQPTPTPATTTPIQPPVVSSRSSGPSFIDDFLIWMWLSNSGFFRGPRVIVNAPPTNPSRPSGDYYYSAPPSPGSSTPSTVQSAQAASRATALAAARSTISGQAAGTGGGVAATNKAAADASARVSAATAKSAALAGEVSTASVGKSTASVPRSASALASRSAGARSGGGFGGKGISGTGGA